MARGSLARPRWRQLTEDKHGPAQPPGRQQAAVEERVSQSGGGTVKYGERIHAEPSRGSRSLLASVSNSWSSAATVLAVAPRCDSSAASAFRPSVVLSSP